MAFNEERMVRLSCDACHNEVYMAGDDDFPSNWFTITADTGQSEVTVHACRAAHIKGAVLNGFEDQSDGGMS